MSECIDYCGEAKHFRNEEEGVGCPKCVAEAL